MIVHATIDYGMLHCNLTLEVYAVDSTMLSCLARGNPHACLLQCCAMNTSSTAAHAVDSSPADVSDYCLPATPGLDLLTLGRPWPASAPLRWRQSDY